MTFRTISPNTVKNKRAVSGRNALAGIAKRLFLTGRHWSGPLFAGLLALPAVAGELVLENGDRVAGELKSINAENVVWASDLLGELTIAKALIESIETSVPLKLRGESQPCHWSELDGDLAVFACDDGSLTDIPLMAIREIVQFEGHKEQMRSYGGQLSVVGSQATGNRNQRDWVVDTSVTMRHTDFRHEVTGKYEQESRNNGPSLSEYEVAYSLDWFFRPQWFWFADISNAMDESRNIEQRNTVGTGVGYQFWESEKGALALQLGTQFAQERYDPDVVEEDYREIASWRLSTDYTYQLPYNIDFFHTNKFLQSLEESERWEVESDTGIRMPIGNRISADVKYEYDYDNLPPEGTVQEDTMLRFGLGYSW